jgi:hypothetical protein
MSDNTEEHSVRFTYRDAGSLNIKWRYVCSCGKEGPERDTKIEAMDDRIKHKADPSNS